MMVIERIPAWRNRTLCPDLPTGTKPLGGQGLSPSCLLRVAPGGGRIRLFPNILCCWPSDGAACLRNRAKPPEPRATSRPVKQTRIITTWRLVIAGCATHDSRRLDRGRGALRVLRVRHRRRGCNPKILGAIYGCPHGRAKEPEGMINLNVERRRLIIPKQLHGVIAATSERARLRRRLESNLAPQMAYKENFSLSISETALKLMITKFSEQRVFQPLNEIRYWFTYEAGAYIEPGYPPLFYSGGSSKKDRSPNKSAISAIGEGIAGFLAQRIYRCTTLARPNHEIPDIVMEDVDKTYLVEAKATMGSVERIHDVVDQTVSSMARLFVSAILLDVRPPFGIIAGTYIRSETEYHVCLTEMVAP